MAGWRGDHWCVNSRKRGGRAGCDKTNRGGKRTWPAGRCLGAEHRGADAWRSARREEQGGRAGLVGREAEVLGVHEPMGGAM